MANQQLLLKLESYLDKKFKAVEIDGQRFGLDIGICYTASWTASKILKRLGYNCYPKRISYVIGNELGEKIFIKQAKTGKFDKDKIIKAGGWVLGLGVIDDDKVRDNHWIVYFPNEKEILDLTVQQASRKKKGIVLRAFWELEDNLPKGIIAFRWENSVPQSHLYKNVPKFKSYLKDVIKEGVRKLK